MALEACFLDVDGVITDFAHLDRQWDQYMGEVLAPALGHTAAAWGAANRAVFPGIWAEQESWGTDPEVRMRREATEILRGMCEHLAVPVPSDDRCWELWLDVEVHVARAGSAVFPSARAALEALADHWALHTATGNPSRRVEAYFDGMGARSLLGVPAGPDLVGIWKRAPEFYDRIFALAEVDPRNAVVVDDSPGQLEIAASRGAHTILVDADGEEEATDFDGSVRVIDELPVAVEELAAKL